MIPVMMVITVSMMMIMMDVAGHHERHKAR